MKFKVKNKLEQKIRFKNIEFLPNEVKILDEKPNSDKFYIEEIEVVEETKKIKGGKK